MKKETSGAVWTVLSISQNIGVLSALFYPQTQSTELYGWDAVRKINSLPDGRS